MFSAPIPHGQNGPSYTRRDIEFKGRRIRVVNQSVGAQPYPGAKWEPVTITYAEALITRGDRLIRKGKPITVGGRKWSPSRAYFRQGQFREYIPNGITEYVRYVGGFYYRYQVAGPVINQALGNFHRIPALVDSEMTLNEKNRLNTELLLKVGQRKVNYGEAIAEGRETVSMLAKSASTLVKAVLAARKGQWWKVPKLLGVPRKRLRNGATASEKWLAYQYGWLPLMGDIYDSYELFKKGLTKGPQLFSAVRNIRREETTSGNSTFQGASIKVLNKAKIWYRISDSDLSAFHQLGLINPLEVAWAIVPFSFVVDWFLPVGNVLEALSARIGITFVDGFYGRLVESREFARQSFTSLNDTLVRNFYFAKTDCFKYTRTVMASLPWPGWYAKNPFSTSHVTSALALLRQLWR